MRLNNEKDQRIPTILIHIPDSVEVIGSDNPFAHLVRNTAQERGVKGLDHSEVGLTGTKIGTHSDHPARQ